MKLGEITEILRSDSVSLQRKISKIPILQSRSNIQVLPPIKATQFTISNQHEQMNLGSRKVSFRLPLIDVKEFCSQYLLMETGECLVKGLIDVAGA